MKRIITLFAFLLISTFVIAQSSTVESPIERFTGIRYSLYNASLDNVNDILTRNNFGPLDNYSLGFEWYLRTSNKETGWGSNFLIGGYSRTYETPTTNRASILGITNTYDLNYNFAKETNWIVRPSIAVGFEYYRLSFTEGITGGSIDNVTNSDIKTYQATSLQLPLTFGLELGGMWSLKDTRMETVANVGYKLHPGQDWNINDNLTLQDDINLSSLYFGFTWGFAIQNKSKQ